MYLTVKQTADTFFHMIPRQRVSNTAQIWLCLCFLKISIQLRDRMSLPKRYEFVESCLQQLIIHVMVVGLCMDAVVHSGERVGLLESTWSHSIPREVGTQCWQCSACGWEACHDCVVSISVSELSYACTSWFWPGFKQLPKAMCTHCSATLCHTTHFNHTEVNWAINHMWFLLQEAKQWASLLLSIWPPFWSNYRTCLLQQPIPNNHSVLIFENDKNKDKMHHLLSQGVPFIVNNIKMQGTFNPNYFVNMFYGHSCCIYYINVGKVDQITAELFSSSFDSWPLICLKGVAAIISNGWMRAGSERKPFWGSEGVMMGWVIIVF